MKEFAKDSLGKNMTNKYSQLKTTVCKLHECPKKRIVNAILLFLIVQTYKSTSVLAVIQSSPLTVFVSHT